MGQVNIIRGDKRSKDAPRKFMVSLTFDIWAGDHEEACWKLTDYLEWALTDGKAGFNEHSFKKPIPAIHVEATELAYKESPHACLDSGKEFKIL